MSLDTERLYDYWPAVFVSVRQRLEGHDPAVVEDLTSEVFEKAIRRSSLYQDQGGGPLNWLLRIAQNVVIDWYRQQTRRPLAPLDVVDWVRATADAGTDRHVETIDLQTALSRLPERQRRLLVGHYCDGYRQTEAAGVVMTRATAHRHQRRALQALGQVLGAP